MLKDLFKYEVLHVDCEAAALENFSDHMGALIILRQEEDITLKRFSDESFFLGHRHIVEYRLNCMCALLVTAYLDEVLLDHV